MPINYTAVAITLIICITLVFLAKPGSGNGKGQQ